MDDVVLKFGGSTLRTPSDVTRIADIVGRYGDRLIVVVSAFFGVTRRLRAAIDDAKEGTSGPGRLPADLTVLARSFLEAGVSDPFDRAKAVREVEKRTSALGRLLRGVEYFGEAPGHVADRILATGEQLSAVAVTAALRSRGIEAAIVWPEEAGLIVDDSCDRITVDVAASSTGLRRGLRTRCNVVPGYYGVDGRGQIRLLGDGGSDYTATAVAACVGARSVHLWKDVPGLMSADPKTTARGSCTRLQWSRCPGRTSRCACFTLTASESPPLRPPKYRSASAPATMAPPLSV
jgi:aspartate kinase/aspartokinase/homoserine dehydrogenase 1